ncbi:MAG: tetratricopeptide repeat protein, partial [Syntrophaceae bacterium]|nr:tetratricopeptide repeat protein [Syntrophaceae bacterium]
ENAQATYRLGDTYRRLGLNYEAAAEFKTVFSSYPRSDYAPESLYMTAVLLYETRRFDEAIAIYKEYIARFPEGPRVREAYFGVGDCYSQLRQFNDANAWYDNALKKWPDLEDIPGAGLLRMGTHYVQAGKYDKARDVLFVYLNLYPDGDHARDALYEIARSFVMTDQTRPALKMFSLLIDRYPGSREAFESVLMMANLGVDKPGTPVPGDILPGMNCYLDPVGAYRAMEGTLADPAMEEEVAFRKTVALIKTKRYREAFDEGRTMLANFPRGKHRNEAEKNLVTAARHLIDGYYQENDHVSVVDLYYGLDRGVLFGNGDYDMLSRIGRSLVEMNLLDHADGFFGQMAGAFKGGAEGSKISLEMAKIDYRRGRLGDAKKKLEALAGEKATVDRETAAAARTLMGDIAWQEGRFKEAAGLYSAALDAGTDPEGSVAVRKRYADALREMGMYSSALVNYRRILDGCESAAAGCSVPVVARSYEGVGECLYRKGEYRQALRMYEQSIKGVPEEQRNMWTLLNIERGYAKLGMKPAEGAPTAQAPQGEGDE